MIKSAILRILHSSRYFRWYIDFQKLNQQHWEGLQTYYKVTAQPLSQESHQQYSDNGATIASGAGKRVICVMNGNFENGGLADRLRTIVSVYQVCKEQSVEFRLLFTKPFLLMEYLLPNTYDWRINADEVRFDDGVDVVCCEVTDDTSWQSKRVHTLLSRRINDSESTEIHVYGNPNYCYPEGTYRELFFELFRLSPSLETLLQDNMRQIGCRFNVMQLRFTTLLGDLTDIGTVLPEAEQQRLIDICIRSIKALKDKLPGDEALVVNSDSTKFLQKVRQEISEAYIVSGSIVHIDYTDGRHDDAFAKLFVEFFLMKEAQRVFRIVEKRMRKSGLPYSAALLSGKQCEDIEV